MSHNPTQRQLLQDLIAQMTLAVGELGTQTGLIAAQTLDIGNMQVSIAAQAADIAATSADQKRAKDFLRWQAEYLAGSNVDLDNIEAGTHTFPSP